MIPKRIVLENFLSFGTAVDLCFDDNEPLWVLCGPNGIGKSSVFDAITFALFGCHRGGKGQGMDELIRHGTNAFRIEFEFAFAGRDYRIIRNYGRRSVERVFQRGESDWNEIDLPTGKNRVRVWSERELGLSYEQFCASVLLKQGEADKIITAPGRERLLMLKQIIGVERYETLSARVREASRAKDLRWKQLARQRKEILPVTTEELAAASGAVDAADAQLALTRDAEALAISRVGQAEQVEKLEQQRRQVEATLREAAERKAQAATIRQSHTRLVDLDANVAKLRTLLTARDDRTRLAPQLDQLRGRETELTEQTAAHAAARDVAKAKTEEHRRAADTAEGQQREKQLALKAEKDRIEVAREVEEIDRQFTELPPDLDELRQQAEVDWKRAEVVMTQATEHRSAAQALLKQCEKELRDFANVESGAICSRCRQPVSAEHAEQERQTLTDEVARLQREKTDAATAEASANTELDRRNSTRDTYAQNVIDRDKLRDRRLTRVRHGEFPSVADLQARIDALTAELDALKQTVQHNREAATTSDSEATAAETRHVKADQALTKTQKDLRTVEADFNTAVTKVQAYADTLTGDWPTQWESLSLPDVSEMERELKALKQSDIGEQFQRLQQDETLVSERERQLGELVAALDQFPDEARVSVAVAQTAVKAATKAANAATAAVESARQAQRDLEARDTQRRQLVQAEREAETVARVHDKLDRALGPDGLQRELVRKAEQQIVRFANETVRNLSDGDLSIELDEADEGPDKAFTLKVRRADDATPIGVNYLSGSQKFRVAVAVALAIGRFATSGTQACPLESVIIDEGFGSLDKDGLRAMADELTRLKGSTDLKRIVLVSHQDEFVNSFPVGWRLSRSDAGTTAEKFRR